MTSSRGDCTGESGAALSAAGAQLLLGQLQLDAGQPAQAVEWFRAAARGGDAMGFNMLGRAAERGWGCPPDPEFAARCYLKAADLGDVWALFNLADLYCRGHGVPQDDAAAYRLYAEAARRGHCKSLNMLGLFHESGRTVPADPEGAIELYRAAADGGDCWGGFNLGRMLAEEGRVAEASEAFARALDAGFPDFFRAVAEALGGHPDPRLRAVGAAAQARLDASPGRAGG